jgi:hypothetical protein
MLHAAAPLRLILVSGADSRREFVELIIGVELDAHVALGQIHHAIRSSGIRLELESGALAIAHRFLDTEPGVGRAVVTITSPRWRHVSVRAKERGGNELRTARAEVSREGDASVTASIEDLTLLAGARPDLCTWNVEWRYRKAAGVAFQSGWAAVRKLVLEACLEDQEPPAVAELILNEMEDIASVNVVMLKEPLRASAEDAGLFARTDQLERRTGSARR